MKLRNLNLKDNILLFKWANLKSVINASIKRKKIIKKKEHELWFNYQLRSKNNFIKIVEFNKKSIGYIRLNKINKKYFLSYLIAPKFRKKGFGFSSLRKFLRLIEKKDKNLRIFALVRKDNKPSQKIFKKLNFEIKNINKNIITFKKRN